MFILVTDSEGDLGAVFRVYTPYFDKILILKLITEGIALVLALHVGIKSMRQNRDIEMSNFLLNPLIKDWVFHFVMHVIKSQS